MKVKIRGLVWTIRFLSTKDYLTHEGPGSIGVTNLGTQTITFDMEQCEIIHIRHEVTHAYYDSALMSDGHPKAAQVEEQMCEIIGYFGPEIMRRARQIFNKIKELRGY